MATKDKKQAEETEQTTQSQTVEEPVADSQPTAENVETEADNIAEVDKLQAQYDEMKDKFLRLNADFENFRRHSAKDKMEILDNARCEIVKNMLPVIDDFERAMAHMADAQDVVALREGVELIFRKFTEFLTKTGIETLDPKGEVFNPDMHEAVEIGRAHV